MKKTTLALCALLALQLALAAGISVRHSFAESHPPGKLMAFVPTEVDGLKIEEAGQTPLVLAKHDGKWILPGFDNAPANAAQVTALVDRLNKLEGGWPVATTPAAAERFKVADPGFERRVSLTSGGKTLATLLLGTSPAYRLTNVRVDGHDSIFSVDFDFSDAGGKAEDWEDKSLLTLTPTDITKIELSDLTLVRDKGGLRAADLGAAEEMVADKTDAVERELATPLYDAILGTTVKPDYGLAKPVKSIALVLKDGRQISYTLGKPAQGDYYVLQSSSQPFLFRLPKYAVTDLLDADRAALVRTKGQTNAAAKPAEAASTPGG